LSVKDDRSKKKKYLNRHYWLVENIRFLQQRLDKQSVALYNLKSPRYTDMPKGGDCKTTEDKILDKAQVESRINQCVEKKKEIEQVIRATEDPQYILLLELRYIDNLKMHMVAENMNLSRSRITELHAQALDALSLPA
jgi:DNA-directed RNA polymerase specialized sigma subunit